MIRVVKRRALKKENDFEQSYFYNMYAVFCFSDDWKHFKTYVYVYITVSKIFFERNKKPHT